MNHTGVSFLERPKQLWLRPLLETQFTHAAFLAAQNPGVALVTSRLADDPRPSFLHDTRNRFAHTLSLQHQKTVRKPAQINARTLGKANPIRVAHDPGWRRGEMMAPVTFMFRC